MVGLSENPLMLLRRTLVTELDEDIAAGKISNYALMPHWDGVSVLRVYNATAYSGSFIPLGDDGKDG